MYIGSETEGHLYAVMQSLLLATMTPAFQQPSQALMLCSDGQALVYVLSPGLAPDYGWILGRSKAVDLRDRLERVDTEHLYDLTSEEVLGRTHCHIVFGGMTGPTTLADNAFIGIRSASEFWWQAYAGNQPVGPVAAVRGPAGSALDAVGLCYGLDLSRWPLAAVRYDEASIRAYVEFHVGTPLPFLLRVERRAAIDVRAALELLPESTV